MKLADLIEQRRNIRVIGFDDSPHRHLALGEPVKVAGGVCAATRFEGMVWGEVAQDGMDTTEVFARMVTGSKYLEQLSTSSSSTASPSAAATSSTSRDWLPTPGCPRSP